MSAPIPRWLPAPRHPTATEPATGGEVSAVLDELRRVRADGAIIELWSFSAGLEDWARVIAWLHAEGRADSLTDPSGAPSAPILAEMFDPEAVFDEWMLRFHVGTSTWRTPFGNHGGVYFWGGAEDFTSTAQVAELLAWARELSRLLDRPVLLLPETPEPESTRPIWRSDQTAPSDPARLPAPRHQALWAAPEVDVVAEFRAWVAQHHTALESAGLEVELSGAVLPWLPGLPDNLRRAAHLQLWADRRAGELTVGQDGQVDLHVIDLEDPNLASVVSGYFDTASSAGLTDALHALLAATVEVPDPPMPAPLRPFVSELRHWEPPATQPWPAADASSAHHGGVDRRPAPPAATTPASLPRADRLIKDLRETVPRPPIVIVGDPESDHGGDFIGELVALVVSLLPGLTWSADRYTEGSGRPHGVAALHRLGDTEHGLSGPELIDLLAGICMHGGKLVGAVETSPAGRWRPVVGIEAIRGREFDVQTSDDRVLRRLRSLPTTRDVPPAE
ncbi:hypothetical protein [Actinomycetospora soli]|uniref:hypothetical protein n=1 Tax=Actinomycetospora soli TaxID=2893887 RepID=UPI001E4818BD|nr:hypothetical protein [Actinomycetospora soli]MCD2191238.1 hypothetical protein [Actinomycetospora soli]